MKRIVISGTYCTGKTILSLSQRLEQVLDILSIPPLHPIDEAVSWAVQERRQIFDSVQLEAM